MGVNIGQAAKASGLSERMIRYFEKQGLIPEPTRSGGGYRSYSADDVKRMRVIALAQEAGFSPEVIWRMVDKTFAAGPLATDPAVEADAMAELDRKAEAIAELRGRIGSILERARSRLPDVEPEVDWAPLPTVGDGRRPFGVAVKVIERRLADRARPDSSTSFQAERDLIPAE